MTVPDDEQLACAIQQGDADALSLLVEKHYSPLMGYLYRMLGGNRPLAEDFAQETFLKMQQSIGQYQCPRPFKPWLYAIASNLARNHFRKADTRYTQEEDDTMEQQVTNNPSPEEAAATADDHRQVIDVLMNLSVQHREVVVLRYYEEHSLSEIADALGIPVGTVKSRLSIGLKRLRVLMEQYA